MLRPSAFAVLRLMASSIWSLLDRQIGRLFTFEDPTYVDANLTNRVYLARSVRHKPPSEDELASRRIPLAPA